MLTIRSYSPLVAMHWFKQGWKLFLSQFVRFSLLFMLTSSVMSMTVYVPVLGMLCSLLMLPLSQMLLFNAAYGTRLRGYFLNADLFQKLKGSKVWAKLLMATIASVILLYAILSFTLPAIPISADAFMNLSAEEMDKMLEQTFTLPKLASTIIGVIIYFILSFWIYPLICWEECGVLKAFTYSFKISMSNALPLSLLVVIFAALGVASIFVIQGVLLSISINIATILLLLVMNTLIIALYISLFVAYMEILYGNAQN